MSKSAKEEIEALLEKRTSKIKELRASSHKANTPEDVVFVFFKQVEQIYLLSKDERDFHNLLDVATKMLDMQMKLFDKGVNIKLHWSDSESDKLSDLKLTSVTIKWSEHWKRKNPDKEPELHVDMGHLFLKMTDL
jgi:hypothetical protein